MVFTGVGTKPGKHSRQVQRKEARVCPVLLEKFNLGQMHKAFFDETKVIKSGKKKNDWEMR